MKKTLFLLLVLGGVSQAESSVSSTFDFDLEGLPESGLKSAAYQDANFKATVTAASTNGSLSSGSWAGYNATQNTGTIPAAGSAAYDYVSGNAKNTSLTLTLENLEAGSAYNVSFVTGLPFEGAGSWNSVSTPNSYESADPAMNTQNVGVRGITTYNFTNLVADENGTISLTINATGSHTPTFNSATISGASTTPAGGSYIFATTGGGSGNAALEVSGGTSGNSWAGALGNKTAVGSDDNSLVHNGDVSLLFNGSYSGTGTASGSGTTVFGVVNAGSVTGDVSLVFAAAGASYGSFTSTNAASVVGAFKGSIGGTLSIDIQAGTFNKDIMGGHHAADATDSIGSTAISISGGSIVGNVYGGGLTGTITGDTAISISSLAPFSGHGESGVISAGGTGGSIAGDSTVSFSGIADGSYAGTVSGGSNVAGTRTLNISNSTLTLNKVEEFDRINIGAGSTLTISGNLSTTGTLGASYDAATVLSKTDNGLGFGTFRNLHTGDGQLVLGAGATLNGSSVSMMADGSYGMENAVYYVMSSTVLEAPALPISDRVGTVYSLGNGKEILESTVVNVGTHSYSGPTATPGANDAKGYYVGGDGTLSIMADVSANKTAGDILAAVQGDGNIILRTAGYEGPDGSLPKLHINLHGKTQVTGDLYLAPYVVGASGGAMHFQPSVGLNLETGADISSFSNIIMGYPEASIAVNGVIGRGEGSVGHLHNVQAYGSSTVYIYLNKDANEHLVLSGDTVLEAYEHGNGNMAGSHLRVLANKDGSTVTVDHLVGESTNASITFASAQDDIYAKDSAIKATFNVESFDFRGMVYLPGSQLDSMEGGSLDVNITLQDGQWIGSSQYRSEYYKYAKQTPSLTLKGTGTYKLDEGTGIRDFLGRVSTGVDADSQQHLWRGTVEVTNLVANDGYNAGTTKNGIDLALYGNAESWVSFTGFKGYLFNTTEGNAYKAMTAEVNMLLTNSAAENSPHGFELANGFSGQVLTFNGDIKGTGDFVVSTTASLTLNLNGKLHEWADGAELKITKGSQTVNFSGEATSLKADVVANNATLHAAIRNTQAVTVDGEVRQENGGELNLTVDTAAGTTFKNTVLVNSLLVEEGSVAAFEAAASAGNVSISQRTEGTAATVADGMSISANRIAGGSAQDALLGFTTDADSTVSGASLSNVSLSSVAGSTVTLEQLRAQNVLLSGSDVEYYSLEDRAGFHLHEATCSYNEVRFESDIFSGMTLASDAAITLEVSNVVDWGEATDSKPTNVTIVLAGFSIEGITQGEGWLEQLSITGITTDTATLLSLGTAATVNDLLVLEQYQTVTYEQKADGLYIHLLSATVPEPTTATLSLLALAALAARRRRK